MEPKRKPKPENLKKPKEFKQQFSQRFLPGKVNPVDYYFSYCPSESDSYESDVPEHERIELPKNHRFRHLGALQRGELHHWTTSVSENDLEDVERWIETTSAKLRTSFPILSKEPSEIEELDQLERFFSGSHVCLDGGTETGFITPQSKKKKKLEKKRSKNSTKTKNCDVESSAIQSVFDECLDSSNTDTKTGFISPERRKKEKSKNSTEINLVQSDAELKYIKSSAKKMKRTISFTEEDDHRKKKQKIHTDSSDDVEVKKSAWKSSSAQRENIVGVSLNSSVKIERKSPSKTSLNATYSLRDEKPSESSDSDSETDFEAPKSKSSEKHSARSDKSTIKRNSLSVSVSREHLQHMLSPSNSDSDSDEKNRKISARLQSPTSCSDSNDNVLHNRSNLRSSAVPHLSAKHNEIEQVSSKKSSPKKSPKAQHFRDDIISQDMFNHSDSDTCVNNVMVQQSKRSPIKISTKSPVPSSSDSEDVDQCLSNPRGKDLKTQESRKSVKRSSKSPVPSSSDSEDVDQCLSNPRGKDLMTQESRKSPVKRSSKSPVPSSSDSEDVDQCLSNPRGKDLKTQESRKSPVKRSSKSPVPSSSDNEDVDQCLSNPRGKDLKTQESRKSPVKRSSKSPVPSSSDNEDVDQCLSNPRGKDLKTQESRKSPVKRSEKSLVPSISDDVENPSDSSGRNIGIQGSIKSPVKRSEHSAPRPSNSDSEDVDQPLSSSRGKNLKTQETRKILRTPFCKQKATFTSTPFGSQKSMMNNVSMEISAIGAKSDDSDLESCSSGENHAVGKRMNSYSRTVIPNILKHVEEKLKKGIKDEYFEEDLFYAEDLSDSDEVWVAHCPKSLEISSLAGKKLNLSGRTDLSSLSTTGGENVNCESFASSIAHEDAERTVFCLLPTRNQHNVQLSTLKLAGRITIEEKISIPCPNSLEISTATKLILPENLKIRHPLLGTDFKNQPKTSDFIDYSSSHKLKKKKKKSRHKEDELADVSFEEIGDSNLNDSDKEKKKKKKKKTKHEDLEVADVQEEETPLVSPKKEKKKKKHKDIEIAIDQEGVFNDSSSHSKKKKKKMKSRDESMEY